MRIDRAVYTRWLSAVAIFTGVNAILARAVQLGWTVDFLAVLGFCLVLTSLPLGAAAVAIGVTGRSKPDLAEKWEERLLLVLGYAVSTMILVGLLMAIGRLGVSILAALWG